MAKASWCTVSPMSGNGDGTIVISAPAHTGRSVRSTAVIVQATNGTKPSATVRVNQEGAATFTTLESSKPDVPGSGGTLMITGRSNSSKLDWACRAYYSKALPDADIILGGIVSVSVAVNGALITKNESILNDPGAEGAYDFVATLTFSENKFPVAGAVTFKITDDTGAVSICTFTQGTNGSLLSLGKSSVSLANSGTAEAVKVITNDDWTVS